MGDALENRVLREYKVELFRFVPISGSGSSSVSEQSSLSLRELSEQPRCLPPEETRARASSRVCEPDEVIGLYALKSRLDCMLVYPTLSTTRDFFNEFMPPERHLYIASDRGSGVFTLMRAMCKKYSKNLLRLTIGLDGIVSRTFFADVIEYACRIQPCVVMFDRCDPWFDANPWYSTRAEHFELAYNAANVQSSNDVWFVYSNQTLLLTTDPHFRRFIGYRFAQETGFSLLDLQRCFALFLCEMGRQISPTRDAHLDMSEITANASAFAKNYKAFTPGMAKEFCMRIFAHARDRAIQRHWIAVPDPTCTDVDPNEMLPTVEDYTFVTDSIAKICPGQIEWRR